MKRWPLHKAHFWETAPFFRLLLPLAAGILCYDQLPVHSVAGVSSLTVIGVTFLLYLAMVYAKRNNSIYSVISFVLLNTFFFFSGISVSYFNDIRNNKTWFGNDVSGDNSYLARVTDAPSEKEHSWKLPVRVLNSIKDGRISRVTGNAFVYLYKDSRPMRLQKGDSLLLPGKWQAISNAGNPFEFDYTGYCRRNNVIYQQTLSENDVRLFGSADPDAAPVIEKSHDWCMLQLDRYIADAKTKGLIQAMLLGDEVNLDEELLQSYSETGIVHIIAISGGNVAIFFFVISFLLWWLKDRRHLWVKYAVALPLVWFYVLMAGAPPSAVRAAIMFSLLAFSVMLQKNNNSLNQLLSTAFLLLCAQPMWLFSVGFQLSFVAVLSLILFYAPVYKWISPSHKVTRLLWGTVAASISAEILVAPLVIYYFHTFPLLFLVANVAAYLFMSLVLVMGIAIIALSWIPVIAKLIGIVTVWIVTIFDRIVTWLQSCNPVSFHFLMLSAIELLIVYVVIANAVLFLLKKKKAALFGSLGAACLLLILFCHDEWQRLQQQRLVVYNTGKANRIELISGGRYSILATDTSANKKIEYAVKPAHINWRAWRQDSTANKETIVIGGKSILVLNREIIAGSSFPVDYLIVNYSGKIDPSVVKNTFSPKLIVVGNNYTKKQQEKLVKECAAAGIAVHSIANDGAFVVE
jgi:competence protein ComEC